MTRDELADLLGAAALVTGVHDLVMIGSQAILASCAEWQLPSEATRSIEADIAVDVQLAHLNTATDESELADQIDGALGEDSPFHREHGYDAQGVEVATATLPAGWRDRLVARSVEASGVAETVGWCLERHDVWASKAAAGRDKDLEFCRALARDGIVDQTTSLERIAGFEEPARFRARVVAAQSFR